MFSVCSGVPVNRADMLIGVIVQLNTPKPKKPELPAPPTMPTALLKDPRLRKVV